MDRIIDSLVIPFLTLVVILGTSSERNKQETRCCYTITIGSPAANATITQPGFVTGTYSPSLLPNDQVLIEFVENGKIVKVFVADTNDGEYVADISGVKAGTYTIRARITNSTATVSVTNITVN